MNALAEDFGTNEPVVWRSRTVREFLVDMTKSSGWFLAPSLLLPIVFNGWDGLPLALMGPGMICLISWDSLVPAPDRLSLTNRQLFVQRGYRRIGTSVLTRKHIVELEVFVGDRILVLHGRHGELDRIRFLGDPLDLARELNIPTRVWLPHEPAKPAGRGKVAEVLSWFVVPAAILVAVFGGMFGALAIIGSFLGLDYIRATFSHGAIGFVAMTILITTFALGLIAGQVAMVGIRRLVMSREGLALLRYEKTDPLRQGKMPIKGSESGPRGAIGAFLQGYNRLAYGPLPECPPIEPERYEPGAFPPPDENEEEEAAASP